MIRMSDLEAAQNGLTLHVVPGQSPARIPPQEEAERRHEDEEEFLDLGDCE